ncbi:site-specific integrase [Bacillus sp. BP-3]|uniref:site-specific integrase n=1 Tax=Bacillus sp. BP-3 TaxID=3022773 RepID=UPI00232E7E68|nr:site-specific integrase [Bacillus sp. BP-3]MDC2866533.1 site-specific integrase [Bacillus sp. BP-3]
MKGSVLEDKKRGTWYFSFDLGNDPFTGKRRQTKRRGFKTEKDAEEALIKLQAEMLNNEFVDLSQMTYSKYLDEWFEERRIYLQKSTYEIHSIFCENVIKPKLGQFKLQKIEPIHIQKFVNNLVNETDYSSHTIHLVFRIVSASLKKAKTMKLIKDNPTTGTTLPKKQRKELNVWSLDDVNYFLREAKNVKRLTRCYIAIVISLLAGTRQGETMALRWSDIDFNKHLIYIKQTLTQAGEIKIGAKNTSSVRSIHIPEKLVSELKLHRKMILEERLYNGREYEDNDLVICTRTGKPMIPRNLRKEFYNLTEKLGLPKIRFHDLRHTHCTMLISQNVSVKLIADRLGHADIETTLNIYSHILPNMQKSVSDELDKIINI